MDKAGDLLKSFLSFYNLEKGQKYVSLFSGWRDIVGEDISSHARAVDIRRGALLIEVDHPGWMQIIQMKQAYILKVIEKKYPELGIRVLHFRLIKEGPPFGGGPGSPAEKTETAPDQTTNSAPDQAMAPAPSFPEPAVKRGEGLEGIADENLKNLLARLGRTIREKSRRTPK
jgi:hypothetical protein